MENLFAVLNQEGVKIVASSRTGSTEVYQSNDGRLKEMETAIGIIGILAASTVAGVIMYFIAKWARGKQGGTK